VLKLDDEIDVNSFTYSLIVGVRDLGIMGQIDVLSIKFYHLLRSFEVACPFVAFNYAKTFS
jgi:hypothetical protein